MVLGRFEWVLDEFGSLHSLITYWRQRGRVVRVLDLKSGEPEFKFRSDHQLDLFQVAPGSTPRLRLYIANWSASCLLSLFQLFLSDYN